MSFSNFSLYTKSNHPKIYNYAIYWTRCNHQYGLHLEDMYLELNAFPDQESNSGPFNLEPTKLTVIPLCFSNQCDLFVDNFFWIKFTIPLK